MLVFPSRAFGFKGSFLNRIELYASIWCEEFFSVVTQRIQMPTPPHMTALKYFIVSFE